MVDRQACERALSCALQKGGDFAEIYFEDALSGNLVMRDGAIDTATTERTHGAGIQVYCGFNSVYVHTCDTTPVGLARAAAQAADAIGQARATGADITLCARENGRDLHEALILPEDTPGATKVEILRAAHDAAKGFDPLIAQAQARLMDEDKRVVICNSDGLFTTDRRTRVRLAIQAIASANGENQIGFDGPGALSGYELFEHIDVAACARQAAGTAITMLKAEQCPAGEMPVVIDNGFGGVIFHEACGHSLEATAIALGNSEFCGKLGQKIASDVVTAVDDGTIPGAWGSINIDDEGTPAGKLTLIENGVLKGYMVDRLNGRRMGMAPTGSARRQSYAYAPTSRMRNTFIAPGETEDDEIIRTMGDGLYARRMGGGSVNPVTGEFNFSVSEGYLVKDGRILKPVRGATLIGRGAQVLMLIDRVGKNLALAEGMCGSISGSVPVCVGQPMIRVSRMTVGGRK